jgi:hypothetical protein
VNLPPLLPPFWYPSEWLDSQLAHFFAGAFLVLALALKWKLWWAWGLLLAWIILKEGVFDIFIERDTIFSSCVDASLYIAGGLLGTAVYYWWGPT